MTSKDQPSTEKTTQYQWTKENPAKHDQKTGFKSLKLRNEIQDIFPMRPLDNTWEEDLKTKYKLVEDANWDKGFQVWRSLPMRSELEQKLGIGTNPIRRTSDFTKKECPEAYLTGFTARKAGPISRPRERPIPIRTTAVKAPVKQKEAIKEKTDENLATSRRESGGVLQDSVIRQNQK